MFYSLPMTYADKMKQWEKRRAKLRALYHEKGRTLREVAEIEGISLQRAAQIVGPRKKKNGQDHSNGTG